MKKIFLLSGLLIANITFAQNALNFDGTDDYIQTSYAGISGAQPRTIEAWINTSTTTASAHYITDYGFFGTGSWDNGERFSLLLNNNHQFRLEIRGWGVNGTTALNDGNWHHVVATFDGTTAKLYVDGIEEASAIPSIAVNTTLTTDFLIGSRTDLMDVKLFEGAIDEVRFWNDVRTPQEIDLYKDHEFCSMPTGLVAYFKINQGTPGADNSSIATLIEEVSANDGTFNGFALNGTTSNFSSGATFTSSFTSNQTIAACSGSSVTVGANTYTTTGVYMDTLISTLTGCDSIVTTDLTINTIDNTTSVSGTTVSANESGVAYTWIDCNNGNVAIPGETSQDFTPTQNGNYAVIIDDGICTDTSNCVSIISVGLEQVEAIAVNLYPVPFTDRLTLEMNDGSNFTLVIRNLPGQVVYAESNLSGNQSLDLSHLQSGNLFVEVLLEDAIIRKQITKQ